MSTGAPRRRREQAEKALLAFLVRIKKIEAEAARDIEAEGIEQDLSAIQAVSASGLLDEHEIADVLASGLRLPLVNLDTAEIDEQSASYVKDDTAVRCTMLPLRRESGALVLAMANPFDQEAIRGVEFSAGLRVRVVVASRPQLAAAIERAYKLDQALRSLLADIPEASNLHHVKDGPKAIDLEKLASDAETAPVIKMVNLILADALKSDASDIHVEPGANVVQVRYRVNGVLEDVMQIPKWAQNPVIARIKVMARLDLTERRIPQDGHLRVTYDNVYVDLRVSSLPTHNGEKIVMRILNSSTGLRPLDAIGLSPRDLSALRSAAASPEGMILVTGPTGSGKTTTLYSLIREILSPELNIVTIENPIEYKIKGISQVEVNDKTGLTFASALRSILRQDPDVILVGEIRDRETAEIAFQAAQTGHLVLSTLHTNDTVATVTRLLELDVEHHVLASSLIAVVAQRLVRTTCPDCGGTGTLATTGSRGRPCPRCRETGFSGRTGVYEVLSISSAMRKELESKSSETQLRALAQREGMTLLRQDAQAKIDSGATTAEEAARIVQVDSRELLCPSCAHPIEEKFSVCPFCSHVLRSNCGSCGKALKPEWKSCPYCGWAGLEVRSAPPPSPPPTPAPARVEAVAPLGAIDRPRVLVVDDQADIRTIVRLTIERRIPRILLEEATNGYEALGRIETDPPHLVVLDVSMPGLDGFEVCRRMRSKLATAFIPVIMLTAHGDVSSKEMGFLAGTDDYVVKPFEPAEFALRVQRLLERTYRWVPQAAATG